MTAFVRVGLVSVLLLTSAFAASPATAKPKPKPPDLQVKTLPLSGQPFALNGEAADQKTTFEFVVVNRGDKPTAHKSLAKVSLVHSQHGSFKLGYRDIPPLNGHEGEQGKATTPVTHVSAGAYRVRACADAGNHIKESDENNNCDYFKTSEPHFYVVNNHYRGTVSGTQDRSAEGGWLEGWMMPSADFGPAEYIGKGNFDYALSGSVYYTDSGGSGCTVTGSGVASAGGDLQLQFEADRYVGTGNAATSYPIFKCGNNDDGETGPLEHQILQTFGDDFAFPTLAFGNQIGGGASLGGNGDENWTWSLTGADD
jgi:CARDB